MDVPSISYVVGDGKSNRSYILVSRLKRRLEYFKLTNTEVGIVLDIWSKI